MSRMLIAALSLLAVLLVAPPVLAHATPAPQAASQAQSEVAAVLEGYRAAVEALDGEAAAQFFWPEAQVYEQGGVEGRFADYLAHHLGPELAAFSAFTFEDRRLETTVAGDLAYATETYRYRIVFKDPTRATVERRGVATSVLERRDGRWRIIRYHSSSRAPRPAG